MKRIFRRILIFGLIGLGVVVFAPFALMALDAAMIAAGTYDDEAVAGLPDQVHSMAIRRRPIWHPILGNEFRRALVILSNGKELFRSDIEIDTGGYAMVQVFALDRSNLLLTDGLNCYQMDLRQKRLESVSDVDRAKMQFIGAFDEYDDHHQFRFFTADERGLKSFSYTVPGWCLE
jgi:hypothetical protein